MEQVIDESSECDEWRSNWWFICHRVCERIFFQLCEMFLICISPVRLLKEMFFSRSSYVLSDGKSPDQEPYNCFVMFASSSHARNPGTGSVH